jgi:hypothetical protein
MQTAARSIATPPSNSLPFSQQRIEVFSELYTATLILVGLVMIVAIAAAIYDLLPKRIQYLFSLNLRYKVPCYQCRYFSHNPYLKCALHPSTVLKELAVDCRDYSLIVTAKQVEK